jgi:hypothetical protein
MWRSHNAAGLRQVAYRYIAQLGNTEVENFDS